MGTPLPKNGFCLTSLLSSNTMRLYVYIIYFITYSNKTRNWNFILKGRQHRVITKQISHTVRRPGRTLNHEEVEIPVSSVLTTVPGVVKRDKDVSFYSSNYPIETQNIEKAADREWVWTVYTGEMYEYRKHHDAVNKPLVEAAFISGNIEPITVPEQNIDITEQIRQKARELGFGEVGFTNFDKRYVYKSKKSWVKFPNAICLALEQDYWQTQTIPSMEAEFAHFGTYEQEGALAIELSEFIREKGYRAQIHSPNDNSAAYIPMFVEAGLGQLGANGQLLSPHFGSRSRLMIISTDADVNFDEPIDYGIHSFCESCQVCVDRCPGRALVKEKVWWRGVEKHKLMYDRCRPVMATYEGCGVCMLVCPIQRYGMAPVMQHFVDTGDILGKGTDNLEGYEIRGKGYYPSGQLPTFDRQFFDIPHGTKDEHLFEQFKNKIAEQGKVSESQAVEFAVNIEELISNDQTGFDSGV
jgi:ferredoxin